MNNKIIKNKSAQEEISKEISGFRFCSKKKSTKAQEEMVGFALILIIVAIIFIVLLAVYIKKPQSESVGNPEVNSFVQSFLQYTTTCEQNSENLTLQRLIIKCQSEERCDNGKDSCKVRNDTLKDIIKESWNIGPENPVKGYSLLILSDDKQFLNLTNNVVTNNYKTGGQDLPVNEGELVTILFNAYS